MNRKNLTAAVLAGLAGAAGIAGTAQAVNLNPDGLGQVLIYPYYTSNDGNSTLLSVVNTTDSGKAVKVRFKEGYNSREVLDFNLYMSAYDVWVAAIEELDPGIPSLIIPDSTCTVPYLYEDAWDDTLQAGVQTFLPYAYSGDFNDGGPDEGDSADGEGNVIGPIPRAMEGHFEMIEMGTLTNDSETAKGRLGTADAVTHAIDKDGVQAPADCQQLVDNWTANPDGMWIDDPDIDITRNSGGLFGGAAIINVGKGTMHAYDAKAIQGYDKKPGGNHRRPGGLVPNINDGSEKDATIFFGVPRNQAVQLWYNRGVDAISATFMHEYTMNEYNIEAALHAASEWVITFPTKNWYVDRDILELIEDVWVPNPNDPDCDFWSPPDPYPERVGPTYNDYIELQPGGTGNQEIDDGFGAFELCSYIQETVNNTEARPPFTSLFNGKACETFGMEIWDREENSGEGPNNKVPPIVSPPPPGGSTDDTPNLICYETNILRFGNGDTFVPVFGTASDLLKTVDTGTVPYDNGTKHKIREHGWARIDWGYDSDHIDYNGLVGLPVTGYWAEQFTNGYLGTPQASVLANYGGMFDHKGNVRQTGVDYEHRYRGYNYND
jgi:hypothetical protein